MKKILIILGFLITTISIGQVPDSLYNQPINLIVTYDADIEIVRDTFNISVIRIPEMIEGTYSLILQEKDDFDDIEIFMEQFGDVTIIGTYRMDGLKYQWLNANQLKRNHTKEKYHARLRPHPVWNEETEEFDDVEYTLIQADSVQVNRVLGWKQRKLLNN